MWQEFAEFKIMSQEYLPEDCTSATSATPAHLLEGAGEQHILPDCSDSDHEQDNAVAVLENVCLAYGNHEALHKVDISIRRGTITAIVGPNGSGKTSLLRIMAKLSPPTVGTVCWHDVERTAMVEQQVKKDAWMPLRVDDALRLGRWGKKHAGMLRRLSKTDRDIMEKVARRMDVEHLRDRQVVDLSVGQHKRVRLAMCLAQEAELLLLDEPESGLDPVSHKRIFEEIAKERENGVTVVMSTHKLEEARCCDHVILLNKEVMAQGEPAEMLSLERLTQAFGVGIFASDA